MQNGIIELTVFNDTFNLETKHDEYKEIIESYFLVEIFENSKKYEIKESAIKVYDDSDNLLHNYMKTEAIKFSVGMSTNVRFIVSDNNGKIISDSKKEEENKRKELIKTIQKSISSDGIILRIFNSYKESILNPNNELVYLYEIRDAIQKYFGNTKKTLNKIDITRTEWNRLGEICNKLPLNQGRHRGNIDQKLRDATKGELSEARRLSKNIIEAIIQYENHQ